MFRAQASPSSIIHHPWRKDRNKHDKAAVFPSSTATTTYRQRRHDLQHKVWQLPGRVRVQLVEIAPPRSMEQRTVHEHVERFRLEHHGVLRAYESTVHYFASSLLTRTSGKGVPRTCPRLVISIVPNASSSALFFPSRHPSELLSDRAHDSDRANSDLTRWLVSSDYRPCRSLHPFDRTPYFIHNYW